jgi:hypothetical protein
MPSAWASDEEMMRCEHNYQPRPADEQRRLRTKLLHAIAKSLGFRIEQLEIFEGSYTSVGWGSAF